MPSLQLGIEFTNSCNLRKEYFNRIKRIPNSEEFEWGCHIYECSAFRKWLVKPKLKEVFSDDELILFYDEYKINSVINNKRILKFDAWKDKDIYLCNSSSKCKDLCQQCHDMKCKLRVK